MEARVKIKTQTKRSTTFKENVVNANIIYPGIEIGLASSGSWGNFDIENPKVQISISGDDYECTLSEFKALIRKNLKPIK